MADNSFKIVTKEDSRYVRVEGFPELEGLDGVEVGEGVFFLGGNCGCLIAFNSLTGKMRTFVATDGSFLIDDEEIDFEAIRLECLNGYNNACQKAIKYGGISRWGDFSGGITALSWTLYPDGIYFADSDGYGMEDNDEETVYAVIDTDFQIIEPFRPIDDVKAYLKKLREKQ